MVEKHLKLNVKEEIITGINETYIDARYPADLGLLSLPMQHIVYSKKLKNSCQSNQIQGQVIFQITMIPM